MDKKDLGAIIVIAILGLVIFIVNYFRIDGAITVSLVSLISAIIGSVFGVTIIKPKVIEEVKKEIGKNEL
jgi:hypothetical protein